MKEKTNLEKLKEECGRRFKEGDQWNLGYCVGVYKGLRETLKDIDDAFPDSSNAIILVIKERIKKGLK